MSINSFGVGGTNAHAILDDAYHFVKQCGLSGRHRTAIKVPTPDEIAKLPQLSPIKANSVTDQSPLNGDKGAGTTATNGDRPHREWKVLEEMATPPQLVGLSAFDEGGVARNCTTLSKHLNLKECDGQHDPGFVRDFAFTMHKRSKLGWRRTFLANNRSELASSLCSLQAKPMRARRTVSVAYVFTGQGCQYAQMSRELYGYPVFRRSLEAASVFFQSLGAEWSLLDELAMGEEESHVDQPWLAQPSCTAIQVALTELLSSWGISPARVVGHSSGEIAAAFAAGKLNRESAWRVAYYRGLVCAKQTKSEGAMAAVALSQPDVEARLEVLNGHGNGKAVVACINSPRNCTVSGDTRIVSELCDHLQAEGVFARKLRVNKAYHSHHMEQIAGEYCALLQGITAGEPSKTYMFSTVTGTLVAEAFLGAGYWVTNLVSPVRFSDCLGTALFRPAQKGQASLQIDSNAGNVFVDAVLELGPHGALQSVIKEALASRPGGSGVNSRAVLSRHEPGPESLLRSVGHLWSRGYPIDLQTVNTSWSVGMAVDAPSFLVEVPGYVFNRSQKLWYESRLSRNHRLRQAPRHDLFGAPVADWDREVPRWRNFLRIGEQPWLRDHVVTNSYVYPGVGYIIAAVEAVRQIAEVALPITGFRLKDVSIKRALIVPDSKEGIEVMLSMSRVDDSSVGVSSTWRRFRIASYNPAADEWVEHCTGYVAVDYDVATGPLDAGREAKEEANVRKQQLLEAETRCTTPFDIGRAYENMSTVGLKFGPLFCNVSETAGTGNRGGAILGKVTVPNIVKAMPKEHMSPHLIHPATMDSMMHLALCAIMDLFGGETLQGPAVPTFIKGVWLSAKLDARPGAQYRVHAQTKRIAFEKYDNEIVVWDAESGEGRISISGIRATPLDSTDREYGVARKLCHDLTWTPYLDTISVADLQCNERASRADDLTIVWVQRLQLATLLLIHDAVEQLETAEPPVVPQGHLARYFEWLKQVRTWIQEDKVSGVTKSEFDEVKDDALAKLKLYGQIQGYKAEGRLAYRMGSNIVPVLKQEIDPLHLMFGQDDILDHVYADLADLGNLPSQQEQFLKCLAQNRTGLKVLEVGAGVGSSTKKVLECLAPLAEDGRVIWSSVAQYTYTDISAAFFERARKKFPAYQGIMSYEVLDAEKDVAHQGFDLGGYDLIVAQNVIHATANLTSTLSNLRKLLKPGGRFLIQEGTRQDYFWSSLAFGQLPGWWLSIEDDRKWCPFISVSQWDDLLKNSGFSGVELDMPNSQDKRLQIQSLLLTRAVEVEVKQPRSSNQTAIITGLPVGEAHKELIFQLQRSVVRTLRTEQIAVLHVDELKDADLRETLCICIAELDRPVLATLTADQYEGVRQMLTVCKGLLWVTGDTSETPDYGMATGLIRTVRWERDLDHVNLVTLSVVEPRPDVEALAHSISQLCEHQFTDTLCTQELNGEFELRASKFTTSRLMESSGANRFLTARFSTSTPVMMPWKDAGRPVKLSSASPGVLSKLGWVTDAVYDTPLDPTHVEIEVKAMGLNFRDLMIAMGEHMAYSIGCEASGMIWCCTLADS